jgi:hypothetical protein
MTLNFTQADLHSEIAPADVAKLIAAQVAQGVVDPVGTVIAASVATVSCYVNPLLVPTDALKMVVRKLAIYQLFPASTVIPEKRKVERDWAISMLKDMRDGKFPGLAVDAAAIPAPVEDATSSITPGMSGWGSEPSVSFHL